MGPRATFAYVANRGSNDVSAYSIASNGALTLVPGSPFPAVSKGFCFSASQIILIELTDLVEKP
jgi:6-phosphogluconolactonase (cycloisomerase 2 family)